MSRRDVITDGASRRYPILRLEEAGVRVLDCEHQTPKFPCDGYPSIAIPNIRDGRLELSEVAFIDRNDVDSWTRRTLPQGGDVIMTR